MLKLAERKTKKMKMAERSWKKAEPEQKLKWRVKGLKWHKEFEGCEESTINI